MTREHCQCKRKEVEGKILLVQSTGDVVRCNGEVIIRGLTDIIVKIFKIIYTSLDLQTQYC